MSIEGYFADSSYPAVTMRFASAREAGHDFEEREHSDPVDEERLRNPYWRDYGRILYSASFRRLGGKMQMLAVEQSRFIRNRLTHSLEVAQAARAIASSLRLTTTFVAESCALAHDLGNPPFGHHSEAILNELAGGFGGFEGNAQTFRILRRLEKKSPHHPGLNLTYRTLLGVVKYFRRREDDTRKFLYEEDYEFVSKMHGEGAETPWPTIDMQIMDLADELAYAAHDLEDCLSLGYFNVDELLHEFMISEDEEERTKGLMLLSPLVQASRDLAQRARQYRSSEEYSFLLRKELMSQIVQKLLRSVEYDREAGRLSFGEWAPLARGLKKITFTLISRRPLVHLYEEMGETVIRGLFEVYSDDRFNRKQTLLPPEFRSTGEDRQRRVIDFIAGMTDSFAIEQFKRFFGEAGISATYREFQRFATTRVNSSDAQPWAGYEA
jgi:dGTPase